AMRRVLEETGIVFMYAPSMHPAMRHVGPVRRDLAIGTVMNILGPLANPAGAGRQVVGVSDRARLPLLAGALAALGSLHALVVYGEPGLDEISPLGCTHVQEVQNGAVRSWTIDPERFGLGGAMPEELAGGTPADNASAIVDVLGGRRHGGARSAVLLNAAAAIYVAGSVTSYENALALAQRALDDGRGQDALDRDVVLVNVHGAHRLIGRLETNAPIALAIELLDRGRGVVDERDDRFPVIDGGALVDDHEVAVANLLVDHGISAYAQDIVIAAAMNETLRHDDGFIHFECLDGHPRGDAAQ